MEAYSFRTFLNMFENMHMHFSAILADPGDNHRTFISCDSRNKRAGARPVSQCPENTNTKRLTTVSDI